MTYVSAFTRLCVMLIPLRHLTSKIKCIYRYELPGIPQTLLCIIERTFGVYKEDVLKNMIFKQLYLMLTLIRIDSNYV